jgi:transcriptional regulator with XRE-family HTH domain
MAIDGRYRLLINSMNEAILFGQLLRATRKGRRVRIAQLADKVGIGSKHLGRVERGEKVPSFELIVALANALNVSPSEFFEFDTAAASQKLLNERVGHLLENRDINELRRAYRVLNASLNS